MFQETETLKSLKNSKSKSKIQKFTPQKSSLCFSKWNVLALILKKISYNSGNGTLHFPTQAQSIKKSTPKNLQNVIMFSKKKAFFTFQKKGSPKKLLIFQEVISRA